MFRRAQWQSLEQLALAAALGCSLPLLLRLLRDEEWADERQAVERLVHRLLLPPARTAEQGQEQGQEPAPGQQQAGGQEEAAAQRVAAHWRLRRQLAQQQSAASEAQLQELLLLHLFAAAFLVQQLSSSSTGRDAEQLQRLLSASGLPCELLAPGSQAGGRHAERGKRRRRSSKQHRHSKRRRSDKNKSSSRKHTRRKSKRHSSSSGSDTEGGSGSGSDSDGEDRAFAPFGAEAAGGEQAPQLRWRLQRPNGSAAKVSSLELLDAVIDAAAWAHASWLFAPV